MRGASRGGPATALALIAAATATAVAATARAAPGDLLVRLRDLHDAASVAKDARAALPEPCFPLARLCRLRPRDAGVAARLAKDPRVLSVEPDARARAWRLPDDPMFAMQWGLHNTGQEIQDSRGRLYRGAAGADVRAADAWDDRTDARDVVVAIVDQPIHASHPDTRGNLWVNLDEIAANRRDDDGDGYTDDVRGFDVTDREADLDDRDPAYQHGMVAFGVMAARGDDGFGVAGVAWRAQVMSLDVSDPWDPAFNGLAETAEGLAYAAAHGARVVSLNAGHPEPSAAEGASLRALARTGALVVVAAGNEGQDLDLWPIYPPSIGLTNLLVVTSTDAHDAFPTGANYGARTVDLAAPGVDVVTTTAPLGDSLFAVANGTSVAAPFAAGAAALLFAAHPAASAEEVHGVLLASAERLPSLDGLTASGGRLDVAAALDLARETLRGAAGIGAACSRTLDCAAGVCDAASRTCRFLRDGAACDEADPPACRSGVCDGGRCAAPCLSHADCAAGTACRVARGAPARGGQVVLTACRAAGGADVCTRDADCTGGRTCQTRTDDADGDGEADRTLNLCRSGAPTAGAARPCRLDADCTLGAVCTRTRGAPTCDRALAPRAGEPCGSDADCVGASDVCVLWPNERYPEHWETTCRAGIVYAEEARDGGAAEADGGAGSDGGDAGLADAGGAGGRDGGDGEDAGVAADAGGSARGDGGTDAASGHEPRDAGRTARDAGAGTGAGDDDEEDGGGELVPRTIPDPIEAPGCGCGAAGGGGAWIVGLGASILAARRRRRHA